MLQGWQKRHLVPYSTTWIININVGILLFSVAVLHLMLHYNFLSRKCQEIAQKLSRNCKEITNIWVIFLEYKTSEFKFIWNLYYWSDRIWELYNKSFLIHTSMTFKCSLQSCSLIHGSIPPTKVPQFICWSVLFHCLLHLEIKTANCVISSEFVK